MTLSRIMESRISLRLGRWLVRSASAATNTEAAMTYYQQHQADFLEGLKTFLRIPSISTLSEHKPDIRRAAEFAVNELRAAGMTVAELIEGEGNPLVYAEWLGAPGKPTLLFYGHYDVQPPDPLDEWKSPPFEPEVRGDNIYARGACDDKGQVYIQIKAVEGLLKTTGKLPVNVKFLLEGEEETGGEHIEAYVKTKPPRLQGRCRGGLRHRDVRARAAHDLRRTARHGVLRTVRAGRGSRSALGRVWRRGAQSDAGDRRDHLRAEGSRRAHPGSGLLRPRGAAQREGARGVGAAAVRRARVHREGNGRAGTGGRARRAAVRAGVGAAHAGGPRHSRRIHGRRREDGDSGARRGQDQHAAGGGPARGRSHRADAGGGEGGVSARESRRSSRCCTPARRR